jgi:hypothetical protein
MKKYIAPVILILFMIFPSVGYAHLLSQIQTLMSQIDELQKKMGQAQTELRTLLKDNLKEGMTDEDIKKVQELLATDPDIYPRGLVTGYFGPLTKDALSRFQKKFNLKVTGEIDEETRTYLEEFLGERFGDKIPPGLLRAPGIQKKIELRMVNGDCDGLKGMAFLCKELKNKWMDDDSEDDEGELEIEVEIEDGEAKVKIEYENGVKKTFILDTVDHDEIVDEIVDRTTLTEEEVKEVIEFDEDDENEDDENEDDDDDEDDNV